MDKVDYLDRMSHSKRVVVMMGASWCGPCKLKKPTFLHLKEKHPELHMEFLDGDDEPDFKQHHNITSYPTFLIFENGEEKSRHVGAKQTMAELESWIQS
jgi:thiol-disulfide isomerase/thioredoxin